ncbi:10973_t:CDS:2 [Ambispora leptoticha]|uniref:10973_t:CDS:1 n=1 Tax=Ambispora leptoticha TaxID=144679 RepID=A0A9N8Z5W1_9GLOM|nr:10973_t:CDS:2 [Ambispora leptoticha]
MSPKSIKMLSLLSFRRIWDLIPNSAANSRIWRSYTNDTKTQKSGTKIDDNRGNEGLRYKGYWTLILNQGGGFFIKGPPSAKQENKSLILDNEDNGDKRFINSRRNHDSIASIALKTDQAIEDQPILTVDGEIIPPKPTFPDNCCMSGCAHWYDSEADIYAEEYREWRENTARIRDRLLQEGKPVPMILLQDEDSGRDMSTTQSSSQQEIDSATSSRDPGLDEGMRAFMELERKLKGN